MKIGGLNEEFVGGMMNLNSTENMSKGLEDAQKSNGGHSRRMIEKLSSRPVLENVLM